MHAELNACMRKRLGASMRILTLTKSVQIRIDAMRILSHPITVSQCYVMDEDAALEAQASNSIARTNS